MAFWEYFPFSNLFALAGHPILFSSLPKNQLEIIISHSSEVFRDTELRGKKEPDSSTLPTVPFPVPQFANILMKPHRTIIVSNMKEAELSP